MRDCSYMEKYMKMALELAKKGAGRVNPNPMVGAVIVKDGKVISTGFHEKYGGFHAERNAILNCGMDMSGAEMYVTLEPCCHYGKTPPCTEIIIKSGIKKVIVGCIDDNPIVENKGIKILRENNIEVITGVLEKECRELNEVFFHYIKNKTPFVIMKYAMTADGKISTYTGHSKWITGSIAREHVHQTRNRLSGIMVGIGTVLADNPMLSCRIENGVNPTRIVCDSSLKIPIDCNIVKTAADIPTIIAAGKNYNMEKKKLLEESGITVITTESEKTDLISLMKIIGQKGIDSVLLEGGGELNYSALTAGIVNKVYVYIAPKIFGGRGAKSPVGGQGAAFADKGFMLSAKNIRNLGDDIFIEYDLQDVRKII